MKPPVHWDGGRTGSSAVIPIHTSLALKKKVSSHTFQGQTETQTGVKVQTDPLCFMAPLTSWIFGSKLLAEQAAALHPSGHTPGPAIHCSARLPQEKTSGSDNCSPHHN